MRITMRLLATLLFLLLLPVSVYSIELDADGNGYLDRNRGGINEAFPADVDATEYDYLDGVTSDIQTQLNGKQASMGADDNYVTDAEKVVIGNTSGTNTGDNPGTDDQIASEVDITDAGGLTAQTNVEDYLAENRTAINLNTAKETNTDSQGLDVSELDGTTLKLSLDDDGEATKEINLSSLQDGTGTDDQNAGEVATSTANFDGNLSGSDTTVQAALETLDELSTGGGADLTVIDESTTLSTATTQLTFAGAGVTATEPGADGLITVTVSGGAAPVDSVNSQTGAVVLDADDIDDTSTTNKFTTATEASKLSGIEESADVTDATNVAAAGAVMDGDFTSDGFLKRSGGSGSYTVDTNTYLTAETNNLASVTGTLAVGNGGTGVTTLANLAAALDGEDWTFTGDIDLTGANSVSIGPLQFSDTDGSPSVVGQLRYDNTATGLDDGAFAYYDDDEVKYFVDVATLPDTTGQVPIYNATTDKWVPGVPGGSGDVSKVGTPVDNQVGVWTGDGTIEGTTGLTYDGSNLQLTGDIGSTGTRITKGWFTDLQVTNAIAGSVTGNAGGLSSTLAVASGGTGITSFGTGVATFLGTPSSANLASALTNENSASGGIVTNPMTTQGDLIYGATSGASTGRIAAVALGSVFTSKGTGTAPAWDSAPQITSINLGNASDTTLARSAAGVATIEGVTITRTIASGTATFNPSSVSDGACSSATTGTATGAATTDTINWTFAADPTSTTGYNPSGDLIYIVAYPTANTVNFKACNKSGSAVDPGSISINWKVTR